jgi:hypothetical protein
MKAREPSAARANQRESHSAERIDEDSALTQEEEGFDEIPTVANRANPTTSPGEAEEEEASSREILAGAGAYRIVRPDTSDNIAARSVVGATQPPGKRAIIGIARKSQ